MEGCNINFSCLQNYLKHMYNIEKLALNRQDKSRHEAVERLQKFVHLVFKIIIGIYLFIYFSSTLFLLAYVNCIFVKKLIKIFNK